MTHSLKYAVNCSLLFTELPLLERPAAARAAGFDGVEFWWPFADAVPADREVDDFVQAVRDAGVQLVGLNFFAGEMAAGDRGVISWPERATEFHANVEVTTGIGELLGCRAFNALYGNRVDSHDPKAQDELAVSNLRHAATAASRCDGVVLLEPVSGADRYPIKTASDALSVIELATSDGACSNIGMLADLYHLAVNGDDVDAVIAEHTSRIMHVQIADAPGRHEPGTGELPLQRQLQSLEEHGYHGWVGLEYHPSGETAASFGWLSSHLPISRVAEASGDRR